MTVKKEILCAVSDCGCDPADCECWHVLSYECGYDEAHGVPGWTVEWWPNGGFRITMDSGCYTQSIEVEDDEGLPPMARAMRVAAAALENALDKETP